MKSLIPALLAATALAASLPSLAQAQPQYNSGLEGVVQRQIDEGTRNGRLDRNEVVFYRDQLSAIVRLEANYRRDGLSDRERRDLETRYNELSRQLESEIRGGGRGGRDGGRGGGNNGQNYRAQIDQFDVDIRQGERRGELSPGEIRTLRGELNVLTARFDSYRQSGGGLDANERAQLDRSVVELTQHIRDASRDDGLEQEIRRRLGELETLIVEGQRRGGINSTEAARLRQEVYRIQVRFDEFRRSGGRLDRVERDQLDREINAQADRIRAESRDDGRGPPNGRGPGGRDDGPPYGRGPGR